MRIDGERSRTIIWLTGGLISLAVFLMFFRQAFPAASLRSDFDRGRALKQAQSLLKNLGMDASSYERAILFGYDSDASTFLQKNLGIKKHNELAGSTIPIYYWQIRWFKELQKENFLIRLDPVTGGVIGFAHNLDEDASGAGLDKPKAQKTAEDLAAGLRINLEGYELKESQEVKRKNRADFSFVWEKKDFEISGARLRLRIDIQGDKLGLYQRYLKIPEKFSRDLEKELSLGGLLARLSRVLMFLLLLAALATIIKKRMSAPIRWKLWLALAGVNLVAAFLQALNSLPLVWMGYPDTITKATFLTNILSGVLTDVLAMGLMVFSFASLGGLMAASRHIDPVPLVNALRQKPVSWPPVYLKIAAGYSLGWIFLGYVTIFYLAGSRLLGIWVPLTPLYSNALATPLAFLNPLADACGAATMEEITYRLLAISFLLLVIPKKWPALVFPAILWGFAHSTYYILPVWARGIELTIFGIILAMAFLRLGLETVIIAHFTINSWLTGLPLLFSGNIYFTLCGWTVIMVTLIPALVILFMRARDKNHVRTT